VVLFGTSCQSTKSSSENTSNHFYFVQLTDTHLGLDSSFERAQKVLEKVNSLAFDIQFIAVTGDITHSGMQDPELAKRIKELFKEARFPVYFTPGNHDISPSASGEASGIFKEYFNDLLFYKDINGVRCIFFFVLPSMTKLQETLSDLENLLKKSTYIPVLLFHHIPFSDSLGDGFTYNAWPNSITARWIKLMDEYSVKADICGHTHTGELHWMGKVPVFIEESVIGDGYASPRFRIYEYENGKVSYTEQSVY
jgi:3',5'-cyclic AMP phosphodiesterase CpdA